MEQAEFKPCGRMKIMKARIDISQIENRKTKCKNIIFSKNKTQKLKTKSFTFNNLVNTYMP